MMAESSVYTGENVWSEEIKTLRSSKEGYGWVLLPSDEGAFYAHDYKRDVI